MKIKAVGLLSGGLDSTLATKVLLDQNIEIHAINFTSPFCTCTPKSAGCASVITAVKQLGDIPLKKMFLGEEYFDIIKHPKYGRGKGLNPCIDCRIMKIRKAVEFMQKIDAHFLFTGEVLGQRPMSQYRRALEIIDKNSGVPGLILRPLSAALLEETIPEKEGWVDRTKLLSIEGRSRKIQIAMASDRDISDYPCPAGGCLLTDKLFSEKLKEYLAQTDKPKIKDIALLKVGRHLKQENGDKIIVARNETECKTMGKLCPENDYLLFPANFPAPTVILQGSDISNAIKNIISYTNNLVPGDAQVECIINGVSTKYLVSAVLNKDQL